MAHTCNPSFGKLGQEDCCELKAILGFSMKLVCLKGGEKSNFRHFPSETCVESKTAKCVRHKEKLAVAAFGSECLHSGLWPYHSEHGLSALMLSRISTSLCSDGKMCAVEESKV